MDSTRSRPAVLPHDPAEADAPVALAEAPPGALARLGRLLPGVDALVRFAYRVAGASIVSAGLVVAALADAVAGLTPGALAVIGAVLAIPAAAVALAGWTLADLASLPGQLREAALAATGQLREAALAATGRADAAAVAKGSRIARLVRSLWAARGLAMLTKGGWVKAVGALRFARLASLPFALALLGAVALNGAVIAAGVVALLTLVL